MIPHLLSIRLLLSLLDGSLIILAIPTDGY